MWTNLKAIADAITALRLALESLLHLQQAAITELRTEVGRLGDRVERLQHDLRKPLVEAEALLGKAESRFRTARSSEERARRYAAEARDPDDEEYDDDEYPAPADNGMDGSRRAEGVRSMPAPLEVRAPLDSAAIARAAKFTRR